MRDVEFAEEFSKMALPLARYFEVRMQKSVPQGDKAVLVEDLVQLTAMSALEKSRKPEYKDYPIKALLLLKARNIWAEYTTPPKRQIVSEPLAILVEEKADKISELHRIILREELKDIESLADEKTWEAITLRNDGFDDDEITAKLSLQKDNLRQKIHRLRKKIKLKWKETGLL